MPDPLSADRTAELLLWYFEEPARYRAEGRRRDAPLLDAEVVLKLALGRRVGFVATTLNGAQTVAVLRDAAALYVRFLFFRPDATPYQTLGLAPGASPEAIKESFRLLMHLVHPDRQDAQAVWPDSFAALANRAYGVLRNQEARARFDREGEARAAMARAIHRAAAASAASKMPVVLRPRPQFGGGLLRRMRMPEWLTAGVGGYAREHPAAVAYSILVGVAVLAIGTLGWEGKEGWLTREIQEDPAPAAPRTLAAAPASATPAAFAVDNRQPAPAAPAPAPSPIADTQASKVPAPNLSSEDGEPAARAAPASVPAPAQSVAKVEPDTGSTLPSRDTGAGIVPAPPALANPRRVASPPVAVASAQVAVVNSALAVASPPVTVASPPVTVANPPVTVASPPVTVASPPVTVASPPVTVASPPVTVASTPVAPASPARAEPAAMVVASAVTSSPPVSTEIESLFAMFVEAYERGRIDAFAALFDDDAYSNLRHGRAAIRVEYDEFFRLSQWRKMQLTRVNWKRVGDRAVAKGEITVRIGWRDGREVEQRLALDMELVRRDGRVVIARLSQQPKN